MRAIDLNSDLGEGFGAYRMGDDEAMLGIVTSANVACGVHAGDPEIMARVFKRAKENGIAVGAHPGYPDLWGFGRRAIPFSAAEIERLLAYQIGAAQGLATYAGHRVTHVKAHGALGNLAADDRAVAEAVARAVKAVDATLVSFVIAGTESERAAERAGLAFAREIFADRAYTDAGTLVPRGEPGAVIDDAAEASRRVRQMLDEGAVIARSGKRIPVGIDTVCVHGDTPSAVAMAARLRLDLAAAGYRLAPFRPAK